MDREKVARLVCRGKGTYGTELAGPSVLVGSRTATSPGVFVGARKRGRRPLGEALLEESTDEVC
jgi:hypothetical protein